MTPIMTSANSRTKVAAAIALELRMMQTHHFRTGSEPDRGLCMVKFLKD